MQIEQLAKITGVSLCDIRRYRTAGLLPTSEEHQNKDSFSESDVHALKLIKLALTGGLSLREIITLLAAREYDNTKRRFHQSRALLEVRRDMAAQRSPQNLPVIVALDTLAKELKNLFR